MVFFWFQRNTSTAVRAAIKRQVSSRLFPPPTQIHIARRSKWSTVKTSALEPGVGGSRWWSPTSAGSATKAGPTGWPSISSVVPQSPTRLSGHQPSAPRRSLVKRTLPTVNRKSGSQASWVWSAWWLRASSSYKSAENSTADSNATSQRAVCCHRSRTPTWYMLFLESQLPVPL